MRRTSGAGFSVIELITVVTIMAILAALAAPSLHGMMEHYRTSTAMQMLSADLAYARMLAVRSGASAAVRFRSTSSCAPSGNSETAADQYLIVLRTTPERVVKTVSVRQASPSLCLQMDRDSVAFNSRGLLSPPSGQKIFAVDGKARDSLSISFVGRVLRRY